MISLRDLASLMLLVLLVGCASKPESSEYNPPEYNYQDYYKTAFYAQQVGAWSEARLYFAAAIKKAQAEAADDETLAVLYYEYGRTSGVVCKWEQAEKALDKAYRLDAETDGPVYMALYELSRLLVTQKKWEQAAQHYGQAYAAYKAYNAEQIDPQGYALFLDDYADLLQRLGREPALMSQLQQQAQQLKMHATDSKPSPRSTPYGQEC